MKHICKVSDNDVVKAIKVVILPPKALNVFIDTFIKQASILGKKLLPDNELKDRLRFIFTSNDFLKPFIGQFRDLLTDDEISTLLEIYQSPVMKKWLEHGDDLFGLIYRTMSKHVEEIGKKGKL